MLSEESGRHHPDRAVTVVVDPVDGSTNASRGIPWFATSLCAVDAEGPLAALVVNLVSGTTYVAERNAGATGDGKPLQPSARTSMGESLVALSGFPGRWLGWYQYRALGAAALDLCAVASGVVDAYIDCSCGRARSVGLPRRHARVHGSGRRRCRTRTVGRWSCSSTMLAARRSPLAIRRFSPPWRRPVDQLRRNRLP